MNIRRFLTIIAFAAALAAPRFVYAQTNENKFDGNNPYTQLIPQPKDVYYDLNSPCFVLKKDVRVVSNDPFLSDYLAGHIKNLTGEKVEIIRWEKWKSAKKTIKREHPVISILIADNAAPEGREYSLEVQENAIFIFSNGYEGAMSGIQTLLQLLPPQTNNFNNRDFSNSIIIPQGRIEDSPSFRYRGFELDVSRTWRPAEDVYKVLDWMAYHKLNKFHWHLTDDQGWRVEIKSLPLLTEKGAWRGPDEVIPSSFGSGNKRYGGYYTQQQIKDIVKYAADRGIEIIPEIETPGHSAAIAGSYPEIL